MSTEANTSYRKQLLSCFAAAVVVGSLLVLTPWSLSGIGEYASIGVSFLGATTMALVGASHKASILVGTIGMLFVICFTWKTRQKTIPKSLSSKLFWSSIVFFFSCFWLSFPKQNPNRIELRSSQTSPRP